MLTEDDLDYYMISSGYVPQSRQAMRPQLARGVRWLTDKGVERSPLRPRLPWYSFVRRLRDAKCLTPITKGLR
jgi:hypothetical protein